VRFLDELPPVSGQLLQIVGDAGMAASRWQPVTSGHHAGDRQRVDRVALASGRLAVPFTDRQRRRHLEHREPDIGQCCRSRPAISAGALHPNPGHAMLSEQLRQLVVTVRLVATVAVATFRPLSSTTATASVSL
jgi:hypothetical protein